MRIQNTGCRWLFFAESALLIDSCANNWRFDWSIANICRWRTSFSPLAMVSEKRSSSTCLRLEKIPVCCWTYVGQTVKVKLNKNSRTVKTLTMIGQRWKLFRTWRHEVHSPPISLPLPSAFDFVIAVVFKLVFRIYDILVWIRIRGSMPLTNGSGFGSGSGSCYFRHWLSRRQQKTNLKKKFFCLLGTFWRYIYIKSPKEVTKQ